MEDVQQARARHLNGLADELRDVENDVRPISPDLADRLKAVRERSVVADVAWRIHVGVHCEDHARTLLRRVEETVGLAFVVGDVVPYWKAKGEFVVRCATSSRARSSGDALLCLLSDLGKLASGWTVTAPVENDVGLETSLTRRGLAGFVVPGVVFVTCDLRCRPA